MFAALATLAVLQSLALYRFSASVNWSAPAGFYVAILAALAVVGVQGCIAAMSPSRA